MNASPMLVSTAKQEEFWRDSRENIFCETCLGGVKGIGFQFLECPSLGLFIV